MRPVMFALMLLIMSIDVANAEKRVALVIGNSRYEHMARLDNPENDATDMAAALSGLGFQVVHRSNLDKAATTRAIEALAKAADGADIALFFFSGHGVQSGGRNYLLPIDARADSFVQLEATAERLETVQAVMETRAKTNLLFLDACRNNPLTRSAVPLVASAPTIRDGDRVKGLAPAIASSGTLIGFATQPGNVALDGNGRNSPFSAALAHHLATSSGDLNDILIATRNDVKTETKGQQVPWEHSALVARVYLKDPRGTADRQRSRSKSVLPAPVQPATAVPARCSATAHGNGAFGAAVASGRDEAQQQALSQCAARGAVDCRVTAIACR